MEVVALIRRVFFRLVAKMSDRFLEQRINIKFCVKLGNNKSNTCVMLSGLMGGGETAKNPITSEWRKLFKESACLNYK
jgi:hypothetical protein